MPIEATALSHTGMLREHNEDAHLADSRAGLFIVADGMGGHQAGNVASRLCVENLQARLAEVLPLTTPTANALERALRDAIDYSHRLIQEAARGHPERTRMGTTVALLLLRGDSAILAHVGDSRIYLLRDGLLRLMTRDHSVLQELVGAGVVSKEEALHSHSRNLITQALGLDEQAQPDITHLETRPGDLFLLCSDGLNTMVSDDEMQLILTSLERNPALAGRVLVQVANDKGGHDNITLILARVTAATAASETRRGWLARLFARLFGN